MGTYSIGPLLAKANLEGAHFSERVHIRRRALNGIIIVTANIPQLITKLYPLYTHQATESVKSYIVYPQKRERKNKFNKEVDLIHLI